MVVMGCTEEGQRMTVDWVGSGQVEIEDCTVQTPDRPRELRAERLGRGRSRVVQTRTERGDLEEAV